MNFTIFMVAKDLLSKHGLDVNSILKNYQFSTNYLDEWNL